MLKLESSTQIATNPVLDKEPPGFLERYPYLPFRYFPSATPRTRAIYMWNAIRMAQERGAVTYVSQKEGQVRALLQRETLPWDSRILGFLIARITHWISPPEETVEAPERKELLQLALDEAKQQGIQYLLARVPAGDIRGIHLLEQHSFETVDGLLTFGRTLSQTSRHPVEENGIRCALFRSADLPRVREIAAASFSLDRFHADPVIGESKADELHQRWIEDSCAGSVDCVLVAHTDQPIAFTTLRVDPLSRDAFDREVGIIVLVATSPKYRRRGAALRLTFASLDWLQDRGCGWAEVGTQLANADASRLYQAAGFRLVGSTLTLRRLL